MKSALASLLAVGAIAIALPAAAAPWQSINQRQATLEAQIQQGIRSGALTSWEAERVRADFRALASVEASYRRNGLDDHERADLDRRFDALSREIYNQKHNNNQAPRPTAGQWRPLDQRQAMLEAQIQQGIRSGQLTSDEAALVRSNFRLLQRVEADYRRNGLNDNDRADLDRRFDALTRQIYNQAHDKNQAPGPAAGQWRPIDQRQASLEAQIQQGVRSGQLTNDEAALVRSNFRLLQRVEADYSRNGLTSTERADLDRRFDALTRQIYNQKHDTQVGARAYR